MCSKLKETEDTHLRRIAEWQKLSYGGDFAKDARPSRGTRFSSSRVKRFCQGCSLNDRRQMLVKRQKTDARRTAETEARKMAEARKTDGNGFGLVLGEMISLPPLFSRLFLIRS